MPACLLLCSYFVVAVCSSCVLAREEPYGSHRATGLYVASIKVRVDVRGWGSVGGMPSCR